MARKKVWRRCQCWRRLQRGPHQNQYVPLPLDGKTKYYIGDTTEKETNEIKYQALFPEKILTKATPYKNVSSGICRQGRSRSDCASAQSDQDLCCLLTESINTTEYLNGEQRCGWYFAHGHILHMLEDTFSLAAAYLSSTNFPLGVLKVTAKPTCHKHDLIDTGTQNQNKWKSSTRK